MASCNSGGFGAFLGGALLGALAAVLLAPQRGIKTRSELRSRIHKFNEAVYLDEDQVAEMVEAKITEADQQAD